MPTAFALFPCLCDGAQDQTKAVAELASAVTAQPRSVAGCA
jgi:hypothetical protein